MWRVLVVVMMLAGCAGQKDAISLVATSFDQLPGFSTDNHAEALRALRQSCKAGDAPVSAAGFSHPVAVDAAAWQSVCRAASVESDAPAKQFFQQRFTPYRVAGAEGKFTGYYVPMLHASRQRDEVFHYPAYAMPPELKNGTAKQPYFDRAAIDGGALAGRGLELLWFDDPVMLFFAHVQGSATVALPDGKHVRLIFAGKNGLPYHAIGKTLVESGELAQAEVSMQSIRDWLYAHPAQAAEVMQSNPSYIFFALDEHAGEVRGAHGSPLTPGRSLAVDKHFIPLGLPLYLASAAPDGAALHRIVMAQDTGSAIVGAARGDVFFGYGDEAEALAGKMNATGTLYLLLPKAGSHGDSK